MTQIFKVIWIFLTLLFFTIISAFLLGGFFSGESGNVAVIKIEGSIVVSDGTFFSGYAASNKIIDRIADAQNNPEIKAVIFEINSPGGSVVGTKEIYDAMNNLEKPKICLLRETAASGAYWIASTCDLIIANEFTITGSLGVSGSYLEFSKLMEDYGIGYVRLVSGEKKDIGTPYREPTSSELEQLQNIMDDIYASFLNDISLNRNLLPEQLSVVSDGSVFTGRKALELGLVDVIGGKQEAVNAAMELANLTTVDVFVYKDAPAMWEIISAFTAKEMVKYLVSDKIALTV